MSKSLGNFFTVRDLLEQGVAGEVIRFVFLQTHYRKPMDWTEEKRAGAEQRIVKWATMKHQMLSNREQNFDGSKADSEVIAALADDLNTPAALTRLYAMEREVQTSWDGTDTDLLISFFDSLHLLGFEKLDVESARRRNAVVAAVEDVSRINALVAARFEARRARDFAKADAIRIGLAAVGVEVTDTPDGSSWDFATQFDLTGLADLARTHGA